jgi:hypothetical protein
MPLFPTGFWGSTFPSRKTLFLTWRFFLRSPGGFGSGLDGLGQNVSDVSLGVAGTATSWRGSVSKMATSSRAEWPKWPLGSSPSEKIGSQVGCSWPVGRVRRLFKLLANLGRVTKVGINIPRFVRVYPI